MTTKLDPGEHNCYASALPDEPMFTLLARDPHAPDLVLRWAKHRADDIAAGKRPLTDQDKVVEAYACAIQMVAWRRHNRGKRPWHKAASPHAFEEQFTLPIPQAGE